MTSLHAFRFGQVAVILHFTLLAVLWVTRELGGVGGWGDIFDERYGSFVNTPIAIMYRNIKRINWDQKCFLNKFTFYQLQEFDFNDISLYFLQWPWHFRTVTDSTPAILISISLFLFPSMLPHNFKGTCIVN